MSAQDRLALRQYKRSDNKSANNLVKSAVRGTRHSIQVKEMLVSKFLSKNRIEIKDNNAPESRDSELRMQVFVSKEFEKFLIMDSFTQKNLQIFERELKNKLIEYFKNDKNISIKQIASSITHRSKDVNKDPTQRSLRTIDRNSKTVTNGDYGCKLPEILPSNSHGRYNLDGSDNSQFLKHSIHKKTSSTKFQNYPRGKQAGLLTN